MKSVAIVFATLTAVAFCVMVFSVGAAHQKQVDAGKPSQLITRSATYSVDTTIEWVPIDSFSITMDSINNALDKLYARALKQSKTIDTIYVKVINLRSDVDGLIQYKDAIVSGDIKIEGIVTK